MDTIDRAVTRAREAAEELSRHPNNRACVRARTMSLVALVRVVQDTGHVGSAQTLAAEALGCDRQLIHRHVKRAVDRGWAEWRPVDGEIRLVAVNVQGVFSDVVEMETIGAPMVSPTLPPFTFPQASTIV